MDLVVNTRQRSLCYNALSGTGKQIKKDAYLVPSMYRECFIPNQVLSGPSSLILVLSNRLGSLECHTEPAATYSPIRHHVFLLLQQVEVGICMRVVCREWSESELPFQSPEVPSVSVSASRARSFQEGQAESSMTPELSEWPQLGVK